MERRDQHSTDAIAVVRHRATHLLELTFPRLRDAQVIPRPEFSPWIRMARDYYGEMVLGGDALAEALGAAFPDRFGRVPGTGYDSAFLYSSSLIEAAVAAATLAEQPYEVDSPAIQAVIDELIAVIHQPLRARIAEVLGSVSGLATRLRSIASDSSKPHGERSRSWRMRSPNPAS